MKRQGLATTLLALASAAAQQEFTAADYAARRETHELQHRRRSCLAPACGPPGWPTEQLLVPRHHNGGAEFVLVDPVKGTRAAGLRPFKARRRAFSAAHRPELRRKRRSPSRKSRFSARMRRTSVTVQAGGRWKCDVKGAKCVAEEGAATAARTRVDRSEA